MCKMLIDLKVTNEIYSSEFANSPKMLPNPMEATGRQEFSVTSPVRRKSFACQCKISGRKQEAESINIYTWFKREVVLSNQLRF